MSHFIEPADMKKIRRIPIEQRSNLVHVSEFASVPATGSSFMAFMESLPRIKHRTNAADSLVLLVRRVIQANQRSKPVSWALGPHIVKYGLTPLIIELMKRGLISAVLTNGAGAIHDVEIAMIGATSEEMGGHISKGDFGMAKETGQFINEAAAEANRTGRGFGETLGEKINTLSLPYAEYSLLAQAYRHQIPVTIHVAIGTDIIHMHPDMNGCDTGNATYIDFKKVVSILRNISGGGVHINIGSTVILPEVFVKAMTAANNLNGYPATDFMTVNIDHLSEYRPLMNVVRRGSMDGGEGHEIIGRMEILVPLLVRLLMDAQDNSTHS